MSCVIKCSNCGVALNLPDEAHGRKVKCPKCGVKFLAEDATPSREVPGGSADSTLVLKKSASSGDLPLIPTAPGDLRETFDLPMMTEAAPTPRKANPAGGAGQGVGAKTRADALALFDDAPRAPRKKTGAEGRAQARRCPTCGSVVPIGMALCQTCGLDLDTGTRLDLMDDLAPPPPPASPGPPLPIAIIGGFCTALSVALAVAALVFSVRGQAGTIYFVPVALFGTFAAIQFLRGKSVKLLLAALTLGAVINVAAFIALPVYNANAETTVEKRTDIGDDPDAADEAIRPVAERLDTNSISVGITVLFLYALVCVYLLSPQVNRHFSK
jgi:hypothetical protein